MDFKEFKNILFEKALNEGFENCEVYYTDGENISITVYEGEVEKYNIDKSFGLSFRGMLNGKMGYSYTEILDDKAIDMLIKSAKEAASCIESNDIQFIYEGDENYSEVKTYSEKLENIDASKLIDIALELEKETKGYSDKVINLNACKISYSSSKNGIYNTKGLELNNKGNLLISYVIPIVEENNEKQDGIGYMIVDSIGELDTKKIAKQGVEDALSKLGGKSIPSGNYKTIIYNEAMASLLETFSDVFSAEEAQRGLSLLNGKEGKIIASDIVSIIDDPLMDNGLASAPFDDEGVATFKKEIVSKGVLNTLLHNLKTANKANLKTTGNGFKSSYSSPVSVEPTNFYIEKGMKTLEELMNEVDEGVIITDFAGLHSGANSITGDFSLASKGFYIRDGRKIYPIDQITVAGNFFELLKNIKDIGNDLNFPISSIGSPSVVVEGLSIAGK
ncbi:modulator of DNA gyrase [[Clostridium] sordellii]|uniref:Modulator of DNA gyrase, peptidase U62 n=1 Tax=Paraclostridium sordellii TaxID=1505 RepID=A0ABP1XXM0_PARSO|nr:TldD/PmbA family protein [Paeniclostridium sordellii]CEJ74084.1 putative modulator of DNA gyrase, peptidase U62 [[Clostridium] sordellii] [Paeniclostridium sordellii]CEN69629.1 modulator of DNA gyrase [[Clostridium] sordellii] [Paeniclostridium sordellii]CEN72897.1 modulator of DNA gyrase [[Clostridium] sordellii] [Paeniclostridium sordellii]CEO25151.1 modulator of DNA gyrase [[Clostridium] sordellii] [Paeniclostridium sordellii]CEP75510.1 modulator of DNA gyrase [[Clostridium] sordellii] [